MVMYNGYEVFPAQMRTRSTGFTDAGHSLEDVKKVLETELGDGEYLGRDQYAEQFLKNYKPLLESIWKMLDDNAKGLHGVKGGLDEMATTYEHADIASTVQAQGVDQALEDLVPGIVKPYVGWIVGMDWPEADEDAIFKKVEAFTNAGKGTDGVGTSGDITLAAVKACMDGVAADSFGKYWDQFTKADPQFLPNLTKACNEAAKQLESYGLDVEYTKYMILFSLVLLAFQIAYFIAMAAPRFCASLSLIPGACAITQMGVRQLAITLLRNILFSTAIMEGMDAGIQGIQMLEGHRKSWDWDKTKASIEGGVMTGLAFTGMAGLLSKVGGSRLASAAAQDLKFGELTGREKFATV